LVFSDIITIIKSICILFNIISSYKYIKVFKLLINLDARTCIVVLLKGLYTYNLLLSKGPFYLKATVFYKVSIEFVFKLSWDFKKGK